MGGLAIVLSKIQQENLIKSFSCLTSGAGSGEWWPPRTPYLGGPGRPQTCWHGAVRALLLFSPTAFFGRWGSPAIWLRAEPLCARPSEGQLQGLALCTADRSRLDRWRSYVPVKDLATFSHGLLLVLSQGQGYRHCSLIVSAPWPGARATASPLLPATPVLTTTVSGGGTGWPLRSRLEGEQCHRGRDICWWLQGPGTLLSGTCLWVPGSPSGTDQCQGFGSGGRSQGAARGLVPLLLEACV